MKTVLYTQRVEFIKDYQERRDCADQRIPQFLLECGFLPIPVPNIPNMMEGLMDKTQPAGIVLTGGNSLVRYGGDAPERDAVDRILIQKALERGIPLYGFCRGMQSILDYFGVALRDTEGHVAVRHPVEGGGISRTVNSYHRQAAFETKDSVEVLCRSGDGVIEAISAGDGTLAGTMWHPEREAPFAAGDLELVKALFTAQWTKDGHKEKGMM